MEREIVIGRLYRHFKGTLYRVTGIATHTETGEKLVIYRREDGTGEIWARPYAMFTSEVDHKKYPDAKQKYRFEEVKTESRKAGSNKISVNSHTKTKSKKNIGSYGR